MKRTTKCIIALALVAAMVCSYCLAFSASAAETNYALKATYAINLVAADDSLGDPPYRGGYEDNGKKLIDGTFNTYESTDSVSFQGTGKKIRFAFTLDKAATIGSIVLRTVCDSNFTVGGNRGILIENIPVKAGTSAADAKEVTIKAERIAIEGSADCFNVVIVLDSAKSYKYIHFDIIMPKYVFSFDEVELYTTKTPIVVAAPTTTAAPVVTTTAAPVVTTTAAPVATTTAAPAVTTTATPGATTTAAPVVTTTAAPVVTTTLPTPTTTAGPKEENVALKASYSINFLNGDEIADAVFFGAQFDDGKKLIDGKFSTAESVLTSVSLQGTGKRTRFGFTLAKSSSITKIVLRTVCDSAFIGGGNRGINLESLAVNVGSSASKAKSVAFKAERVAIEGSNCFDIVITLDAAKSGKYVSVDATGSAYIFTLDEVEIYAPVVDATATTEGSAEPSGTTPKNSDDSASFVLFMAILAVTSLAGATIVYKKKA